MLRTVDTGIREEVASLPPVTRRTGLKVSIVMPCLDEAATVGTCVRKAVAWLERSGLSGEVIVVDNGSTDSSPLVASEAGARVIHEPRRGYGRAYLRGIAAASGDYIVMGDSDDTYDFSDIGPLIAPLRQGYDLVIGNRYMGGIRPGAMTWSHKYIGTPAISWFLRLCCGISVGDSQCGMRAFTRQAWERLRAGTVGMEFASEMILKAGRLGLRVAEVPVPYFPRAGETKLRTFRDGWRHLRFLLVNTPRYAFLLPSLLLLLAGLMSLAVPLVNPGGLQIGSVRWQPIFAGSVFLTIGANGLMLGLISTYYAVSNGLVPPDRFTTFLEDRLRLEYLLGVAGLLIALGLALDAFILGEWLLMVEPPNHVGLAAIAQTAVIVGGQLVLTSLLFGLLAQGRWHAD